MSVANVCKKIITELERIASTDVEEPRKESEDGADRRPRTGARSLGSNKFIESRLRYSIVESGSSAGS